jgi:hypothetical protein
VRPEARLAHLALAYLRGRPYKSVERTARSLPDPLALHKKVSRLWFYTCPKLEDVQQWLNE